MIVIKSFLLAYYYLLFVYMIMSYFPSFKHSVIGGFVCDIVEPYLNLFRSPFFRIHVGGSYIDLSYLIAMLVLVLLLRFF